MAVMMLLTMSMALAYPNAPPASEASIDAFIAALPPAEPRPNPGEAFDQDRLERLIGLNPERQAEVRLVFDANEKCEADAKRNAAANSLRSTARRLGDRKLNLLTSFYRGQDYSAFSRLSQMDRESLTPADKAELDRITATYPLEEFAASTREEEKDMWSPEGLIGEFFKCWEAYEAEMERRKLKR